MENFTIISMKTKNSKIYLGIDDKGNKKWVNNKNDALWFEDEDKANSFAKSWFKNFEEWFLENLTFDKMNMKII